VTKAEFLRKFGYRLSKKTPYEERYVDEVLARVPNLDWSAVKPQKEFDDGAVTRFIDFAISEGDLVRIAIEVDGFDKKGEERGMNRPEFAEFSARGQAIVAEGWRLIRVANSLIDREPAKCARTVELVLKRERALEQRLASLPQSDRSPDEARRRLDTELLDADERRELRELNAAHQEAIAELEQKLEAEVERREGAERDRDRATEARDRSERDNRGMLKITSYFLATLITLALIGVMIFRTGSSDGLCADAGEWQEAGAEEGSSTTLRGPVVSARYQAKARGKPTFLDVGQPYPDTARLVLLIWGDDREAFPNPPETAYAGRVVAASGEVERFRGVAQMAIDSPADIEVCTGGL